MTTTVEQLIQQDVNTVLEHLNTLHPAETLSLKLLSLKIVIWMTILSGQCCQTIHALRTKDMNTSTYHNYQLRMQNCHVRFILTVDNENLLCEKKKYHSRLPIWFFLSRWAITSQGRVFWRDFLSSSKWQSNWVQKIFTEFIDSLTSIVERTAYCASDHVGLEICARKLEETQECLLP